MNILTTIIRLELTAVQALTLCLIHLQGPQRMTAIATACRISTAGATGLVDALDKRGLATRLTTDPDRRAYAVALTPEGISIVTTILGQEGLRA